MRWVVCAALLLGCKIDGTIGRDDPKGGGEGGGTEAAETSATDPGSGGASEGFGTAGGTGGSGGEGAPTTSGAGESGRDTMVDDVPAACVPTPDDGDCARCRKHLCCLPLLECLAHDGCICWWDCLHTDHSVGECAELCGEGGGGLYDELLLCQNSHCDTCLGG